MTPNRFQVLKDLTAIINAKGFDRQGVCNDPGRYENESLATIYFHQQASPTHILEMGTGEVEFEVHQVSQDEHDIFGLEAGDEFCLIKLGDNGHLQGSMIDTATLREYLKQNAELEAQVDDDDTSTD